MTPRFQVLFRYFARRFFAHLAFDDATLARLRDAEAKGAVVYVMRYASRLDYFLFNTLFARDGLRLSAYANGIQYWYYTPWWRSVPAFLMRALRGANRGDPAKTGRARLRRAASAGESSFLFLRTARLAALLRSPTEAIARSHRELEFLDELAEVAAEGKPVHVVPLALFWRKGPRAERRFLNLYRGASARPGDLAKVTSFLLTYRDLSIKTGEPIDLTAFLAQEQGADRDALVRRLRRKVMQFVSAEERVAEGPLLRPRHKVREIVLADPGVRAAIAERASSGRGTMEAALAQSERAFDELAANMSSAVIALLAAVVGMIFRRLFQRIETRGLEKIAEHARKHPVVLVPSHRSYFDFLILSWLFYENYLVPPHILARENMAFGPFGFLFRRAGAFFMRRSLADPIYKAVFRAYVMFLVREGFTQEFFIEGARSRTGKALTPRLGMLSWTIQGFVDSGRRDLFYVPVAISYERLVEEGAMVHELAGGKKENESMLGLMRARKVLSRSFGSVYLNFGEPVSLAETLGARAELWQRGDDAEPERRALVESFGRELVERINWSMVATATSVVAAALLGEPHRGMFREALEARIAQVVGLLRLQGVRLTPALDADIEHRFAESIDFLIRLGLIRSENDSRGELIYFDEPNRRALDVYRNGIYHALAAPSLIARRLLSGSCEESALREHAMFWLELLDVEWFAPRADAQAAQVDAFLDAFTHGGVIERSGERVRAKESGRALLTFLAEQTRCVLEAYYIAFCTLESLGAPATAKSLEKASETYHRRAQLLGEVRRPEGWNPVTFKNALDLMATRGVLKLTETTEREAAYERGPEFAQLAPLRARLAAELASG
ncbi:MAG TPA: 1-acyl-sn-glycerol-3-phosphate acyltransferase [Myxococcota bacterium]